MTYCKPTVHLSAKYRRIFISHLSANSAHETDLPNITTETKTSLPFLPWLHPCVNKKLQNVIKHTHSAQRNVNLLILDYFENVLITTIPTRAVLHKICLLVQFSTDKVI